jgi:hypothetical protein
MHVFSTGASRFGGRIKGIAAAGLLAGLLAITPAAASAHGSGGLPDAEIFATNNTAVITDPADPRLDKRLNGFARKVTRIIEDGGGTPRGSQLLDGVFFSSAFNYTTFERSRDFDVDDVSAGELRVIAERVRRRFNQQSVLTFDYLPAHAKRVDGVELEAPGVSADALRQGLLDDQVAREALFGGSVTQDGRLLLVADLANAGLARSFAAKIGADIGRAITRPGDMEFVG